jgi:hypothetical protein
MSKNASAKLMLSRWLLLFLLLFQANAWATETFVTGVVAGGGSTVSTYYYPIMGIGEFSGAAHATETSAQIVAASSGTLSNLRIKVASAPTSGKSWLFTLRVNAAGTSVDCTIADAATSCYSGADTASITAGDLLAIEGVPTGTPAASGAIAFVLQFDSTTTSETLLGGNSVGNNISNAAARYHFPMAPDGSGGDSTQSDMQLVAPVAGTFKNLYCRVSAAPGSGKTWTFTMMKSTGGAFSDTSVVTTISGTSEVDDNSGANSFTVAAGDRVILKSTPSSTPAAATLRYGITFVPNTEGQFLLGNASDTFIGDPGTNYAPIVAGDYAASSTESLHQSLGIASTIKGVYAICQIDPGSGATITYTFRAAGSDSGLFCTVTGTGSGEKTCSATTDATVSDDDYINTKVVGSSSPTASAAKTNISYYGYIAPAAGATRRLWTVN